MTQIELSALPRRRRPAPAHPLHKLLLDAGINQTDAALALGCARSWLSPILHGLAKPGKNLAARMESMASALREELDGQVVRDDRRP